MNKTRIEWCSQTWNPVTGCFHNCEYCYVKKIAERFGRRIPDKSAYPLDHNVVHSLECKIKENPYPFIFEPTLLKYRLDEPTLKKKPQTIFVCSMADLFGAWVPAEWIETVFEACAKTPHHRYMFLTKNPQRYINLAEAGKLPADENMWYGTTATTPDDPFFWGDRWNTFISIEPIQADFGKAGKHMCKEYAKWIIVGAETGNRKEKIVPKKEWIDGIACTCKETGIPLFLKDSISKIVGEENMIREFPWK